MTIETFKRRTSTRERRRALRRAELTLVRQQLLPAALQRAARFTERGSGCASCAALQGDLIVQQVADGAIELGRVGALKHHGEVGTVLPMGLEPELSLHELMEARAGERIGDTHSYIIRLRG